MYARHMSFKRALPDTILRLLALESSNREDLFIFKADKKTHQGVMPIEDNAESEEIIPFWSVQLFLNWG